MSSAFASLTPARLHRALWRWHFYAGLLSLPFLLLLAVTGAVYLFESEIDRAIYNELMVVTPQVRTAPTEMIVRAAQDFLQGWTLTRFETPEAADRAAAFLMERDGQRLTVYIDPYTAEVLGTRNGDGPMAFVLRLHSLTIAGPWANLVVEAVAGWTVILFGTGIYLWWPRGVRGKARSPRGCWRTLHVYAGLGTGTIIVFLAATGLPWSAFWGNNLHRAANEAGLGTPPGIWSDRPLSSRAAGETPWLLQRADRPLSEPVRGTPSGFARATKIAETLDITPGFAVEAPWGEDGVFTVLSMPSDATKQRVLHIDQYSGAIVGDIRFDDYGPVAQTVEFGVSMHMGRQFGPANKALMLLGCLGLVALCVSSLALAWSRRHLPFSPPNVEPRSMFVVSAILTLGLLVFPITAVSAALIAIGDTGLRRDLLTAV